ncbi:MAG TPA: AraC family transcriptional regulator [Epulopiscium sp.]|nr:AraC family transcriptional regulator [Candidatus Epulonipiscium sp.]
MGEKEFTLAKELLELLPVELKTSTETGNNPIKGVYCGDLLSWVMAKAQSGNVWITIQSHINVIAVASLIGIPAIIIVEGSEIDDDVIKKAEEEEIAIFTTHKPAYEIASLCAGKGI